MIEFVVTNGTVSGLPSNDSQTVMASPTAKLLRSLCGSETPSARATSMAHVRLIVTDGAAAAVDGATTRQHSVTRTYLRTEPIALPPT
jgi:hypothetical protein